MKKTLIQVDKHNVHKSEFTQIKLKNLLLLLEIYIISTNISFQQINLSKIYLKQIQDKQKFIEHKAQFLAALKHG